MDGHSPANVGLEACRAEFADVFSFSVGGFADASYFENHAKKKATELARENVITCKVGQISHQRRSKTRKEGRRKETRKEGRRKGWGTEGEERKMKS